MPQLICRNNKTHSDKMIYDVEAKWPAVKATDKDGAIGNHGSKVTGRHPRQVACSMVHKGHPHYSDYANYCIPMPMR